MKAFGPVINQERKRFYDLEVAVRENETNYARLAAQKSDREQAIRAAVADDHRSTLERQLAEKAEARRREL
jgi:hypothetical protein